jgi:hypothetical protein
MENVTLSTGRTVLHRAMENGATEAFISESIVLNGNTFTVEKPMTNEEWQEYCRLFQSVK